MTQPTDDSPMRNATWTSVEAMGIPPSRVRDVLFDLAGIIDAPLAGEELALGSSALRGVMAALEEHYKPRTALEVQVEMIRVGRELAEMGMPVPAIAFTHEDFELPPESPQELARQLGYRDGGAGSASSASTRLSRASRTHHVGAAH